MWERASQKGVGSRGGIKTGVFRCPEQSKLQGKKGVGLD